MDLTIIVVVITDNEMILILIIHRLHLPLRQVGDMHSGVRTFLDKCLYKLEFHLYYFFFHLVLHGKWGLSDLMVLLTTLWLPIRVSFIFKFFHLEHIWCTLHIIMLLMIYELMLVFLLYRHDLPWPCKTNFIQDVSLLVLYLMIYA